MFSKLLLQSRRRNKLTQRELAKRVSMSHVLVGYLETAQRLPSVEQAIKLARALNEDPYPFALQALASRVGDEIEGEIGGLSEADRAAIQRFLNSHFGKKLRAVCVRAPT